MNIVNETVGDAPYNPKIYEETKLGLDGLVIDQLQWWALSQHPTTFPFMEVLFAYRRGGKHFVSPELTNALRKVRDGIKTVTLGVHPLFEPFLNVMLDKHDGRYDYRTYLALDLLGLPDEETLARQPRDPQRELDRSVILLASDIAKFELDALSGKSTWLPQRAAGKKQVETRCHRAQKALQPYLVRHKMDHLVDLNSPMQSARALSQAIKATYSKDEEMRLQLSHVPVYVVHDEYMFIRILQIFETVFAWICAQLRVAIDECAASIAATIACLQQCSRHLHDAAPFFHLLSTLDPDSFKDFRTYTEGASAIQSRSYKRVESLCAKPAEDRLHSIAYLSVPDVQRKAMGEYTTLDDAYLNAKISGRYRQEQLQELARAMEKFQTAMQRWRQSHYAIAVKMLGKGTGTGYTEGTPYLNDVRNIPVFNSLET